MARTKLKDADVIVLKPDDQAHSDLHHNPPEIQLKHAFAGGLSGCLTRAICQPLDMIKIRFQLQVEPLSNEKNVGSKYSSIRQACKLIIKEERIGGLWKGHNPAQILSIIYGVGQFWSYEELKFFSSEFKVSQNHPDFTNFVCGGISGAIATFLASPLDVVRTRLIAQDSKRGYRNSIQGLRHIYQKEGIKGWYRGVVPALCQVTPLSGANFMFYKFFCEMLRKTMKYESQKDIPAFGLIAMGGLTGITSKTLLYPMDLVKKRLQIQGFGEHRKTFGHHFECGGLWACMINTARCEGMLGLYKGLWPSLLKAGITTAFHFAFYDEICRLIIKDYQV